MARLALTFGALFAFLGCHFGQHPSLTSSPKPPEFLDGPRDVVDSLMATLTMEQRVAQLLMVPIYARTDTAGWGEAERWTRDLGLGGVICMQGGPDHQRVRLKRLQALASVPLMVSSDAEWGLGMRLDSTRSFPRAMTLGATQITCCPFEYLIISRCCSVPMMSSVLNMVISLSCLIDMLPLCVLRICSSSRVQ